MSTLKTSAQADETAQRSDWQKWIVAITVSFGAILEIIDTSIVNVALPDMQGNLGATLSEIGWVITGYTVANAIMIPLTAWLGDYFGKKRYWLFSLVGFTIASMVCGFAVNLQTLVAARVLQGLFGGGLLAKAQSILFETFPPEEQGIAQAIFGMGVIVGPVIGPTLGGYLTDTLGWRWIFFINLPFGILAVVSSMMFLPHLKGKEVSAKIDWLGIVLLIIFIGSFQTFLEQGEQYDWFGSTEITALAAAAGIGFVLFLWRELTTDHPAVELHVLRHKSLTAGSVFSAVLGLGIYGAMFAVPVFTQTFLNYTAMQTGLLMLPGALASAAMMPILGKLSAKVDPRVLICVGATGTAVSMFWLSSINPDTSAQSLFWPLVVRGMCTAMMFIPLSLATMGPLPKHDIPAASGFYNLTRQLGGSVGIAVLTTLLSQRENLHRSVLVQHINAFNVGVQNYVSQLTAMFTGQGVDPVSAQNQAYALIDRMVNAQAAVLSFADLFKLVAILFLLSLPLVFFLGKRGDNASAAAGAH